MLKLNEHYRIENDANNFILKYEKATGKINKTTGKEEVSTNEWYYPKMSMAIDKFLNQELKKPESIIELNDAIKELTSVINNLN